MGNPGIQALLVQKTKEFFFPPQITLRVLLFQMATTTPSAASALMALNDHILQKFKDANIGDGARRYAPGKKACPAEGRQGRTSLALSFLPRTRSALSAPEHADYIWP